MRRSHAEMAIFPLSNVVLFPHVQVPLHLFEPRYRQMAQAVLDGDRRIGMVVVRPEHMGEMAGDPPVFLIGCAGAVTRSKQRADGRFDIVLAGTQRFRILEERERGPERLYRIARVELLDDPLDPADAPRVAALRARTAELVIELIQRTDPERREALPRDFLGGLDDPSFVNTLCNALTFGPAEKQGLLEAASIPERFERLAALLAFRLAELAASGSPDSGSFH